MHPILIHLGKLQVRSYGFMLALSFLLGIWLSSRRAKKAGVDPQKILDLSVIISLAAVVGSRLLYVLFHLDQYSNPLDMFALWQGGATFYGGFILATIASYWWVMKHKIPFLQSRSSGPLLMTSVLVAMVGVALPFSPLGHYLDFVPLPQTYWPLLAAMMISYVVLTQLVKAWLLNKKWI